VPLPSLNPRRLRMLNALSLLALVLYTLWFTTSFQIRHQSLDVRRLIDYGLNYEQSLVVEKALAYPSWSRGFLYPPPNVILRLGLGQIGLKVSAILWMGLLIAATLACLEALLYLLGLSRHPAKYVMAFLALCSVEYFIEWDLRALNGNMIYLASLLGALLGAHKSRPRAAGLLLASSIVLKVYSLVFLPYFLIKRQYRLCLATLLWLGVFFVVLPGAYFGPSHAWAVTENWLTTVLRSSDSLSLPFEYPAYLTSLHKTLLILLNEKGGQGLHNVMDLGEDQVFGLTRWGQAVWLLFVAVYFLSALRTSSDLHRGKTLMMDAGALTLLILPFSPALQPHHGVVMLIPALLLVSMSFDAAVPPALRRTSAAILLAGYIELQFGPSLAIRGLGMMICIVLYMSALILLRTTLPHRPAPTEATGAIEPEPPSPLRLDTSASST